MFDTSALLLMCGQLLCFSLCPLCTKKETKGQPGLAIGPSNPPFSDAHNVCTCIPKGQYSGSLLHVVSFTKFAVYKLSHETWEYIQ